jgi:DMSO/TMAO reductase YedYZ molybdopterin-dependent catalytic subunit
MKGRRQFLKTGLATLAGVGFLLQPFFSFFRSLWAEERRIILPKGTKRESLAHRNPASLDTRNLEITPLKDFQTMGTMDYKVDVEKWRLAVSGRVKKPIALTYSQVQALPATEKRVLLICPGFFANHGLWRGIRVEELLDMAKAEENLTSVTFISQEGTYERTQKFSMEEILGGKVFLAYGVNGESLPQKHGYPLRVVAEKHYGSDWVKYVSQVKVE